MELRDIRQMFLACVAEIGLVPGLTLERVWGADRKAESVRLRLDLQVRLVTANGKVVLV